MPVLEQRELAGSDPASERGSLQSLWTSRQFVLLGDVLDVLLRRWKLVVGLPLAMGIAGFLFFQFRGQYAADSSLTPEDPSAGLASIAGLAARFGAGVGLAGQAEGSIDFYAEVLRSPALLADVAQSQFRFAREPGGLDTLSGTLVELYGVEGDTPTEKLKEAVKRLQGRVSVSTDRLSNVVKIRTKAPYPEMAQQINRRMLEHLSAFNLQKRQSRARANRTFSEERMEAARLELVAVEDTLRRFLETNRTYQQSPRLAFEAARLERRVQMLQQVFVTLVQAFEQARIDEVRDTPVFTVIMPPELFAGRSKDQVTMGLLAMVVWAGITVVLALFLEYLEVERRNHPESFARFGRLVPMRRGGPR